ncbi:Protein of unknown function DUF457, transmembrane [[Leptolyngbya] sp. PCC 7376]|uniref:metal-dependent hydrolase n=1 Tax=[Leptolyngbya] sp. PCC 7376 TaxID=111781 RepID=UPI00029F27DD|nr:metal-dependent hydrolase [[Leptolyngbya] sp. PCC 7376]AFY39783.1 Protein of unknown function DUF457, transmembrane [[Leptolyngbya] sp. PCC 7376]
MSSFVGHGLAGMTVGILGKSPSFIKTTYGKIFWLSWLIVVAITPDFDYVVPFFHPSANSGIRITHSIFYVSLLPSLTLIVLKIARLDRKELLAAALPLCLASFSHLCLDLLVGVTAIPLAWPLDKRVFKLPFGLLPSAGKPSLSNYFFYYNLGIEIGVLLPLSISLVLIRSQKTTWWKWGIIGLLLAISIFFMHWAYGLSR